MGIAKFFVRNGQFSWLVLLLCMVVGFTTLTTMPRGEDPVFGAPIFIVYAVFPGTSPADMEQLVVDPLEEELYNLEDIYVIRTYISDGRMIMRVEFEYGVDADEKNNDVIREVNRVRPDLPNGIVLLEVEKAASSDVAILQVALVGSAVADAALAETAEALERRLEGVNGTKWVRVQAEPVREVQISLDLEKMARYNLGTDRVIQTLRGSNLNIPGGSLDVGARRYNVQTRTEFSKLADIRRTVVSADASGALLHLEDIASVRMQRNRDTHRARYNGEPTVWVIQALKDAQNIMAARKEIQAVLDAFEPTLPDGLRLEVAFDQAQSVKRRLDGLGMDFLIAIGLVMLTLLPLGPRASLIVMISIPLSLSIGLALLNLAGFTLNQLSIVGLVVALGLIVDDSIVVVENIERHLREGLRRREAAVAATKEIGVAVIGCTVTLLLAFLPLTFLPGGAGEFIKGLPMAVLLTVSASLFVAITIIPFLASRILKEHKPAEGNVFLRAFDRYVNRPYQGVLRWAFRYPAWALLAAALVFGASLLLIPLLGFSLFPQSERPMFMVEIESSPGSTLDETDRLTRRVEQYLLTIPEIEHLNTNVGKGNPRVYYNTIQANFSPTHADMLVLLNSELSIPAIDDMVARIKTDLAQLPGARIEVKRFEQGPPIVAPVEFRIIGPDLDSLTRIANRVERVIAATPGTEYVRNSLRVPRTDLVVDVDYDKAGLYGLPPAKVAEAVRLGMVGLPAGTLRDATGDEFPLLVGLGQNLRDDDALRRFDQLYVTNVLDRQIALRQVADYRFETSAPYIQHLNKERYTSVTAFTADGYNTAAQIAEIETLLQDWPLPEGYRIEAAGEAESTAESTGGMGTIILIALFGILAVLVLEFKTFKSTLIVLSVIPLGIVGALVALYLKGLTLGFVATIGMVALVGIEIKNSILLVDYTNQLRAQGMPLEKAILDGAETRFLPILLTAATAIGGLLPLALADNPLISPLAWVLIGGLISSTLLSRIVTPLLYKLLPPRVDATFRD